MNSINLLKAFYRNEKLEFTGDVKLEIEEQNKQSLSPFLYYVYGDVFLNVYLGATLLQERFYKLQKEITSLLNEYEIPHIYFKGTIFSRLYPDSALRTRGDIDFIVKKEDYEKAKSILSNNGFKAESEAVHHMSYMKNNLEVELHKCFYEEGHKLEQYFKNPFNHANLVDKYEYELDPNYHFIYAISHLNKHLLSGEGIRSFLDFYYLHKAYKLDYIYIINELQKIKLDKLFNTVCNVIYEIIGEKIYEFTFEPVEPLFEFLLNNGIHGLINDSTLEGVLSFKYQGSKIKYLFNTLFLPNKKDRKMLYPKLSMCFIFYPIIVIRRGIYLLTKRRKQFKKSVKTNKVQIEDKQIIAEKYGIVRLY